MKHLSVKRLNEPSYIQGNKDIGREQLAKLAELDLIYQTAPIGLCLIDRELRYVHVNAMLASMNGKSVEEHIGRSIYEIIPGIAPDIESILHKVIETGAPLLDIEVRGTTPATHNGERHWLASYYPIKDEESTVLFISTVVQDITERKLAVELQNEHLRFETFLSEISSRFVSIALEDLDRACDQCLKDLVEFLGFDRSGLGIFSEDMTQLYVTHSYARPGFDPFPKVDLAPIFPWYTDKVRKGETVAFSNLPHDLPDEAKAEKEYSINTGFKSHLAIPLKIGNLVLGGLGFGSFTSNVSWPKEFVQRLRIISEIMAGAIARKRAELELKKAFSEIKRLKDQLQAENIYLREEIKLEHDIGEIIGQSHGLRKVLSELEQVAKTDSTVLIIGETGTGKELLAHAIHNQSNRNAKAMIKVNCAALPSSLIENELFGREKGAYTGALTRQIGRFELANSSTIFLDEVGELPLDLQAKLLRVLQDGQFERLGSPDTIEVDVRVIAATNKDLSRAVREGRFREDLYYRLNVFPIHVPPLRERREDIPALVWAFVKEFGEKMGKMVERIPQKTMEALQGYSWPGNIRELRNVIERAMILNDGSTLHIQLPLGHNFGNAQKVALKDLEKKHVIEVLEMTGWRVRGKGGAAEVLGLKPTTLESKMSKLGIERKK